MLYIGREIMISSGQLLGEITWIEDGLYRVEGDDCGSWSLTVTKDKLEIGDSWTCIECGKSNPSMFEYLLDNLYVCPRCKSIYEHTKDDTYRFVQ
jgi:DNA-directed RNA polymerase subunit RPC12/RpoP